jgi:hypothetical protein
LKEQSDSDTLKAVRRVQVVVAKESSYLKSQGFFARSLMQTAASSFLLRWVPWNSFSQMQNWTYPFSPTVKRIVSDRDRAALSFMI